MPSRRVSHIPPAQADKLGYLSLAFFPLPGLIRRVGGFGFSGQTFLRGKIMKVAPGFRESCKKEPCQLVTESAPYQRVMGQPR